MLSGNIFKNIPHDIDEEVIDCLVKSGVVKIERIISRGHTSPVTGWYDQQQNEWVIVLKGCAIIVFDDDRGSLKLDSGDYLSIPAHSRHRVKWTDPSIETVWLAVSY
ncbi:MAG TPA: cupin domain-containing protein [Gammaproteobacteria bacterium]|nr:cupin domain-containing protein [Gammaproteobacteria bacterium]